MSRIQSYKFNLLRRPSALSQSQTFEQEGEGKVLRSKLELINRIPHSSSIAGSKNQEKLYTQTEFNSLARKHELQLSDLRQENLKQRLFLELKNQEYLAELVELLSLLSKNSAALEEYYKLDRKTGESSARDLQREYRSLKERIQEQRYRRMLYQPTQFGLLKKSIINPEAAKERPHQLVLKKAYELKILPHPKEELLNFSHSQRASNDPLDKSKERHKLSLKNGTRTQSNTQPAQPQLIMTDKQRHYHEKIKKLEDVLVQQLANKLQNESLIQELNETVVQSEVELLNLRLRLKLGSYYC